MGSVWAEEGGGRITKYHPGSQQDLFLLHSGKAWSEVMADDKDFIAKCVLILWELYVLMFYFTCNLIQNSGHPLLLQPCWLKIDTEIFCMNKISES